MMTADVNTTKFDEIEEKVLEIRRVSKKTKGGNTIAFAVLAIVGNNNGRVGVGYGKAPDVASSINKAIGKAKKSMVEIKLNGPTISHEVLAKYESAKVFLKPAPKGTGVIAGGAVRAVLELAGIKDISAKMIGANNKISNVRCTLKALKKLKG
ncbi:MAG: 30S ribosomal protein S5 [candidate division WWE3 bacterium GW2011_GWF2_41_45]|uniref:Small ribosomal subunit protein uS5 n=3 Tax=Katanobacteria TaxID=422282 RepID=A0A0G0YSR6_UNCKA|nr:MAG: 30S ribosomal protein S5 [candidate division WWE3 bacterium GW2011_GWC2_41_23]KKS10767.1 MAG: 30S ribosomal protein S5 [candidate division WWE3 bacterium GW2011_GWF2_41_45]KKS12443.1 MAG: 30S ribosomal protein S5 [candidate division WWE3 bacterium GW2011_GWF1_41_53]KKS20178.1 MAG: 30S ribosomal protein S5 [candidate division WWE3 bacterium GW2011_GWE1_41_72]KKS28384.1 MAG: 30S ribosomal protein S5 [candidate division WWE3 bacterium GW2011_GWC1_42_102]KKS29605.1 MAG: 30S ribosomal prote